MNPQTLLCTLYILYKIWYSKHTTVPQYHHTHPVSNSTDTDQSGLYCIAVGTMWSKQHSYILFLCSLLAILCAVVTGDEVDVIVVGGGMAGLSAAETLVNAGVRCAMCMSSNIF